MLSSRFSFFLFLHFVGCTFKVGTAWLLADAFLILKRSAAFAYIIYESRVFKERFEFFTVFQRPPTIPSFVNYISIVLKSQVLHGGRVVYYTLNYEV